MPKVKINIEIDIEDTKQESIPKVILDLLKKCVISGAELESITKEVLKEKLSKD